MDFKTLNKSNQFHYTMPENAEFKNLKELNPDYTYILVTVHITPRASLAHIQSAVLFVRTLVK